MIYIILFVIAFVMFVFPTIRCLIFNLHRAFPQSLIDLYFYIIHKKYNNCKTGVLVAICGLFGKGKTLTIVHFICRMYLSKNNKIVWCDRRKKFVRQVVNVISNVNLNIPYIPFTGLQQIVDCATNNRILDDLYDTQTVTLVLGDEFSVQMNSRSFKTNIDPLFLNTLLTCRHHHISLYYTAQRFGHVDALLRQVTSYVIECDKLWRFQRINYYDAWQLENASSPEMVRPYFRNCWYVRNKDYNAYGTYECVKNLTKSVIQGDMISENEILLSRQSNPDSSQILKPSKKLIKLKKKVS